MVATNKITESQIWLNLIELSIQEDVRKLDDQEIPELNEKLRLADSDCQSQAKCITHSKCVFGAQSGKSCAEIGRKTGQSEIDGFHLLVHSEAKPKTMFCQGNLTIFQNRFDGTLAFNRTWEEYKNGFGDAIIFDSERRSCFPGEFWLGNSYLSTISSFESSMLRVSYLLTSYFSFLF